MQLMSFIIAIFLTRLLDPSDFGLIGMVSVFIGLSIIFIDMGFGAALIQIENVTDKLYNTIFWLNLFIGLSLTILVFFSSRLIAEFYHAKELVKITKALSPVFVIGSLGIIPTIRLSRKFDFKTQALVLIFSNLIAGASGILLAFFGYGVWALVTQQLVSNTIKSMGLFVFAKWIPAFYFSKNDLKLIWNFSSKKFLSEITRSLMSNLDLVFIGRWYSPATLGFYTRSRSLTNMVYSFTSGTLNRVFFPYISQNQKDVKALKKLYLNSLMIIGFISVWVSSVLYISSSEIFLLLFTEKWARSAYVFSFLVVAYGFTKPLGSLMISMVLGLGFAGVELKYLIIKRVLWLIPLGLLYMWGFEIFLYGLILHAFVAFLIDCFSVTSIFTVNMLEQLHDLLIFLVIAILAILVITIIPSPNSTILSIAFNTIAFSLAYICGIYFINKKPIILLNKKFKYLISNNEAK